MTLASNFGHGITRLLLFIKFRHNEGILLVKNRGSKNYFGKTKIQYNNNEGLDGITNRKYVFKHVSTQLIDDMVMQLEQREKHLSPRYTTRHMLVYSETYLRSIS